MEKREEGLKIRRVSTVLTQKHLFSGSPTLIL